MRIKLGKWTLFLFEKDSNKKYVIIGIGKVMDNKIRGKGIYYDD